MAAVMALANTHLMFNVTPPARQLEALVAAQLRAEGTTCLFHSF